VRCNEVSSDGRRKLGKLYIRIAIVDIQKCMQQTMCRPTVLLVTRGITDILDSEQDSQIWEIK